MKSTISRLSAAIALLISTLTVLGAPAFGQQTINGAGVTVGGQRLPDALAAKADASVVNGINSAAQSAQSSASAAQTAAAAALASNKALVLNTATQIATTVVPSTVDTIYVGGYDSNSLGYFGIWKVATKPCGAGISWRILSANGVCLQLSARDGIYPVLLGAPGRAFQDSTQGVLRAFAYAKEAAAYLVAGSPDPLAPRGGTIVPKDGWYEINAAIPIFSRLKIIGLVDAAGGNTDSSYFKTTATSLFTLSQNTYETANKLDGVVIKGVSFQGRDDLTTNFIDTVTDSYTISAFGWRVTNNTFRRLKPIPLYLLDADWRSNYHLDMPAGNVVFGGSDSRVIDNNFNGDGYTAGGTTYAPKEGYPVVYLRDFDNGRFERNYVTGKSGVITGSTIVRPIPLWMTNCNEDVVSDNWFDLSNASGVVMQSCFDTVLRGGRIDQVTLYPPSTDMNGAVEISRYRQNILLIGSQRITIDDVENREGNYATVGFYTQAGVECDEITVNLDTPNLVSHTLAFRFQDNTSSKSKRIFARGWENNRRILPMAPTVAGGTSMLAPFVMQATYSNKGLTADIILNLPTAISGRRFRVYQAVASGSNVGLYITPGDAIRGQSGKTGISLTGADLGKFIELICIIDGTWEVATNAASPTYF